MDKCFGIARFAIKPGEAPQFMERARECMRAAEVDLAGTQAYEWFVSADASQCVVIEAYDGVEGMAHHSRHVGKTIPALLAHAASEVVLLGDVPDSVVQRMAGKFGGVDFFGPRFQGRLTGPAPGTAAPEAGGKIFAIARFTIEPGKLDEFRSLAAHCMAGVEASEPGTIGYEWFLDRDGRHCVTLDVYRDAAALRAHMANTGPTMEKILRIVKSEVELYGAMPAEMVSQLKGSLGVRFVAPQCQGVL
ncbi:antibiotic biosynthesis monooxygenase [Massilia cavernae]|uniref:ABM domain-containing protein n=1 Tax=Massilia cavernae TaxID=2320864 RepID=A0A418X735_9BURK|nr:antibiotic biosynthesis monooxygenase [Massilia cavernae]RJG08277.1 hypothetical protein D3872_24720 [Massilia cavernae]